MTHRNSLADLFWKSISSFLTDVTTYSLDVRLLYKFWNKVASYLNYDSVPITVVLHTSMWIKWNNSGTRVSNDGAIMKLYEGISECLWENYKKTRHGSCYLSFFKTQNCSWNAFFVVLPDVVNKREFTSGVVVIHILVWKIMFLPCVACSCDWTS